MSADALPAVWVAGMRRVKSGHHLGWQQLLFLRLTGAFREIPTGNSTKAAEDGLFLSRCSYFFVDHCHPEFSDQAVGFTVLTEDCRVSPFDTGGLYAGRLRTDPGLSTAAEKRRFLNRYSLRAGVYHAEFTDWVRLAFEQFRDYVTGTRPVVPYALEVEPIESRDWLWEGRVPKASTVTYEPLALFLDDVRYAEYVTWLIRTSNVSAREKRTHFDLLERLRKDPGDLRAGESLNEWIWREEVST